MSVGAGALPARTMKTARKAEGHHRFRAPVTRKPYHQNAVLQGNRKAKHDQGRMSWESSHIQIPLEQGMGSTGQCRAQVSRTADCTQDKRPGPQPTVQSYWGRKHNQAEHTSAWVPKAVLRGVPHQ